MSLIDNQNHSSRLKIVMAIANGKTKKKANMYFIF